jgi:polyribonucleotide nucleotidyltransferase
MTTTIAATHKKIVMIESEADQVPDDVMYEGIVQAHEHLQPVLDLIDKMVAEIGKPKFEYEHAAFDDELFELLVNNEFESMEHCMDTDDKNVREARVNEWITMVQEKYGEEHPDMMQYMDEILYKLQKKVVKKWLLAGKRVDGRAMNEIRPLAAEVGVIAFAPEHAEAMRTYTAGLFERVARGEHPSMRLEPEELAQVLATNGAWNDVKATKPPTFKKGSGSVAYQKQRTFAQYLRDAALEGRMGCKIGTVAFYVVLAALIVLAIVHFVG